MARRTGDRKHFQGDRGGAEEARLSARAGSDRMGPLDDQPQAAQAREGLVHHQRQPKPKQDLTRHRAHGVDDVVNERQPIGGGLTKGGIKY